MFAASASHWVHVFWPAWPLALAAMQNGMRRVAVYFLRLLKTCGHLVSMLVLAVANFSTGVH